MQTAWVKDSSQGWGLRFRGSGVYGFGSSLGGRWTKAPNAHRLIPGSVIFFMTGLGDHACYFEVPGITLDRQPKRVSPGAE